MPAASPTVGRGGCCRNSLGEAIGRTVLTLGINLLKLQLCPHNHGPRGRTHAAAPPPMYVQGRKLGAAALRGSQSIIARASTLCRRCRNGYQVFSRSPMTRRALPPARHRPNNNITSSVIRVTAERSWSALRGDRTTADRSLSPSARRRFARHPAVGVSAVWLRGYEAGRTEAASGSLMTGSQGTSRLWIIGVSSSSQEIGRAA
jgi:hypothetical protein